jgi:hypothetical protein
MFDVVGFAEAQTPRVRMWPSPMAGLGSVNIVALSSGRERGALDMAYSVVAPEKRSLDDSACAFVAKSTPSR